MTSGQAILAARKQKGLTQAGLAEALRLTQGMISLYESDARSPSLVILYEIACVCEVGFELSGSGVELIPAKA
jgi:transcriptional regulator with XRE-family HTH domain